MHQSFISIDSNNPLVHCKGCRGVLLVFNEDTRPKSLGCVGFDMRCPHCQKDWHVRIEYSTCLIVELSDNISEI